MAGHSQFKNIMHRKSAQDKKRAKVFTKIIRELTVAAKASPDPESNPRLRAAILSARTANMPKDTMERAIKKGAGGEGSDDYFDVRYEGYGPGGVAIIVEALTDNRNRTAPEVRSTFSKLGGNLGETNSVSFQFDHVGEITYPLSGLDFETLFEAAIELGADDIQQDNDAYTIYCAPDLLHHVRDGLDAKFGSPDQAQLGWKPKILTPVLDVEQAKTLLRLIETLEENDDVQNVFSNFDIDPQIMEKLI